MITVVLHAVILDFYVSFLKKISNQIRILCKKYWEIPVMVMTVAVVFLSILVQIWLWAFLFLYLEPEILPDLESALYFSTSSYTTVGFGDVYLDKDWRLLSVFEAANGFILFGWSTAFIFEIISKLYQNEEL